jgi:hypothetical protein
VKKILEIQNFLATRFVRLVLAGLIDFFSQPQTVPAKRRKGLDLEFALLFGNR